MGRGRGGWDPQKGQDQSDYGKNNTYPKQSFHQSTSLCTCNEIPQQFGLEGTRVRHIHHNKRAQKNIKQQKIVQKGNGEI
jgi:hypothetical protein